MNVIVAVGGLMLFVVVMLDILLREGKGVGKGKGERGEEREEEREQTNAY